MRRNGFTLIELVIIILVVTILATVLITNITGSFSAARLQGARWKLKSDLSYAQSLAVTQQVNHGIIFTPPNSYSVYRQSTGNITKNPLTGKNFTVDYAIDSNYKGIAISSTSFGSPTTNRIEFDSLGAPSNGTVSLTSDGSVTLSYAGGSATVTVTKNTGKVN